MDRVHLQRIALLAVALLLGSCNDELGPRSIYTGTPSPLTGVYIGATKLGIVTPFDQFIGAVAPDGTGYFASLGSVLVIPGFTSTSNSDTIVTFFPPDPAQPGMLLSTLEVPLGTPIPYSTVVSVEGPTGAGTSIYYGTRLPIQFSGQQALSGPVSAGQYQGSYVAGSTVVDLTVGADGHFTGNDTLGCSITGALVPVAAEDEFQVSAEVQGSSLCAGGIYGVAFLQAGDFLQILPGNLPGPYLYVIGVNRSYTKAFAVVLALH